MSSQAVQEYYASFSEREWERLERPDDGAVEFAITKHFLATHLPSTADVLDLGGGPGRYTIWLAEQGHYVTLADLSPELLAVARRKVSQAGVAERVNGIVEADACDLSRWQDRTFDAVVCLGPFYHLPDAADRERAARELHRVLRPGGIVFVAFIPRYALLRRTLIIPDERRHLASSRFVDALLQDGVYTNEIAGRFTHAYGARPQEIEPFFRQRGFEQLALVATEGVIVGSQTALVELANSEPELYEKAFQLIINSASDPSILGLASHLLYVGKKSTN